MTGKEKKMNFPKRYIIRVTNSMYIKLKKLGPKKVRIKLEEII
jgi:hypothetical protein